MFLPFFYCFKCYYQLVVQTNTIYCCKLILTISVYYIIMPYYFIPTLPLFLLICFKLLVLLFIFMFMNARVLKFRPTFAFNRKKKKSFLTGFSCLNSVTGNSFWDDVGVLDLSLLMFFFWEILFSDQVLVWTQIRIIVLNFQCI